MSAAAECKQSLRRTWRQRRRSISISDRRRAARAVARHALRVRALRSARRIGLYHAMGSELETRHLIQQLRRAGKRIYLPVVTRGGMAFRAWNAHCRPHRLGMPQPIAGPLLDAGQLDVIVLPLLAFDARGTRLGQGGGYYDRALERHPWRPLRIGLAYALQQAQPLPRDRWDVPLHAILTERGLRRFKRPINRPTTCPTGSP